MHNREFQNAIRVNHRGFLNNAQKRFVLVDNETGELTFTVFLIRHVENIPVYTGTLEGAALPDGTQCFVGDFSSVTEEGDYFITAGGYTSRQFVIHHKAYDTCQRMMLEYFTWQRCGHALGWNGKCHLDDGYIVETGEHVDLSGGYHQSCDLRKSPGGVSIGVLGMLRFAQKDSSQWGRILTVDEAAWACDYYVKNIQDNGAMYNTLNAPFGWVGREFYQSPAPSSAQWNTTSILATGYLLFRDRDPDRAERYLAAAKRSWDFMTGPQRPKGVYKHPAPFPRGMDPDYFYEQCSKDSTADLGYQMQVAADLYRATGEEKYLAHLRAALRSFSALIGEGELAHLLLRNDGSGRSVMGGGTYAWLPGGFIALCDAYALLGDFEGLAGKIRAVADAMCAQAEGNVWHRIKALLTDADLDAPAKHPVPGVKQPTIRQIDPNYACYTTAKSGSMCYQNTSDATTASVSASMGIFLARAGKLLGEKRYVDMAQSFLDQLLGGNALDSSLIRGIGYNQAQHRAFGQFFPSTPFIPGAIGTAYSTMDVYKAHTEYDMPCVGMAMYLISELAER